ncbi:hypothetical protein AB0F91_11020 [Amycolatopsis sp. NPDC023774]
MVERGHRRPAHLTDLDTYVLTRAREAHGLDSLPKAVRLELDTTGPARVR